MKFIETSGKSVEAAIKNGLAELGCDLSDVDIEILEPGSPGLFGMFGKLAKVRVTVKEKEDDFNIEMPVFSLGEDKPAKKEKPAPKAEKPAPKAEKPAPKAEKPAEPVTETAAEEPVEDEPAFEDEPVAAREPRRERSRQPRRKKPARPAENAPEQTEKHEPAVEPEPFIVTPEDDWNDYAVKAVEFLRETTSRMNVNVTIEVCQEDEALRVRMTGDTLGVLIGRRGETLDSLQYLTSLYVNKDREGYMRVSLDCEGYRAKREDALRHLALRMASRCVKSGRRVVLEPMNPYERRILHSALQDHPYVQTHSEGEDPYRKVIITLK